MVPRFLAAGLVLTLLAGAWEARIVGNVLPLFRVWLDLVDHTYRTVDLSVVATPSGMIVRRLATPIGIHVVGERVVYHDPRTVMSNEAAAGIVLQPAILMLSLLLSWPGGSLSERVLRLALAAALLPVLLLLDVPMMLYGFAWFEEIKVVDPERGSLLVSWADAMNAGGRFVLAIVAAAAAIAGAARFGRTQAAPLRGHTAVRI